MDLLVKEFKEKITPVIQNHQVTANAALSLLLRIKHVATVGRNNRGVNTFNSPGSSIQS